MKISVWVKPAARRAAVGGQRDGRLVVSVQQPAIDGRATESARLAIADALGVRRSAVTLVSGASSRSKVFDVAGVSAGQVQALLDL